MDFPVSEKKQQELAERMDKWQVNESDLEERFIRSQGPGGQHVNKTSTCVVLKHLPSSIEVRCQKERSQIMNRYLARRLLVDKIEERMLGKASKEQQRIEKIRRQKRKRSKRAKEKILSDKHHQSSKKKDRATPSPDGY